jgi:hypothetical protein
MDREFLFQFLRGSGARIISARSASSLTQAGSSPPIALSWIGRPAAKTAWHRVDRGRQSMLRGTLVTLPPPTHALPVVHMQCQLELQRRNDRDIEAQRGVLGEQGGAAQMQPCSYDWS